MYFYISLLLHWHRYITVQHPAVRAPPLRPAPRPRAHAVGHRITSPCNTRRAASPSSIIATTPPDHILTAQHPADHSSGTVRPPGAVGYRVTSPSNTRRTMPNPPKPCTTRRSLRVWAPAPPPASAKQRYCLLATSSENHNMLSPRHQIQPSPRHHILLSQRHHIQLSSRAF